MREQSATMERKERLNADAVIAAVLFLVSFVLHLILTFTMSKGTLVKNDTYRYMKYAQDWAMTGTQSDSRYPMLYPLFLSLAYLFPQPFLAIRIMNQVLCSSAISFIYLTGRMYLNKRDSILLSVASLLMPYQFTLFSQTMSEVLFIPLLWLALYMCLRPYKKGSGAVIRILNDIVLAFLILGLYLTRYISLVIIPVFALVWIMKQADEHVKIGEVIGRGFLIVFVIIVGWLPWLSVCNKMGTDLKGAMGFNIASKTNPEQLTPENLRKVAIMYISYYILLAAPVLVRLIKSVFEFDHIHFGCKFNRLYVAVFGTAAAFFTAVTRHSYRAWYNYPIFYRVMGRYLVIFPIMFILVAAAAEEKKYETLRERGGKTRNLITDIIVLAVSCVLITLSYLIDVESLIYPIRDSFANWKAAGDVFLISMYRYKWLAVILVVQILAFIVLRSKQVERLRTAGILMTAMLCFFIFVPGYYKYYRSMYNKLGLAYTEDLAVILDDVKDELVTKGRKKIFFSVSSGNVNRTYEEYCIKHYLLGKYYKVEAKNSGMEEEKKAYILITETDNIEKYSDKLVEVVGTYNRFDTECSILLLKNTSHK